MTPPVSQAIDILNWTRARSKRRQHEFVVVVGQLLVDEEIAAEIVLLNIDFSKPGAIKQRRTCAALLVEGTLIDEAGCVGVQQIGARLKEDLEGASEWEVEGAQAGLPTLAQEAFEAFYKRCLGTDNQPNWVTGELDDIRRQRDLARQLATVPTVQARKSPGRL